MKDRFPTATAITAAVLMLTLGACASPTDPSAPVPSDTTPGAAGCLRSDGGCLGVLEPGDYSSSAFDPFGTEETGQFAYSVSAGWANSLDHRYGYWLQPAEPYVAEDEDHWGGVFIWADVALAIQDGSCSEQQEPNGATEADDLREALRAIPGLTLTDLPDRRIGGFPAYGFDTEVAADAPGCDDGYVALIASRDGNTDPYLWATGEPEGLRGWFVDLGAGRTVAVFINGPRADLPELTLSAEELISTFRFDERGAAGSGAARPQPCLWVGTRVTHISRAVGVPASYRLCSGFNRNRDGVTRSRDEHVA